MAEEFVIRVQLEGEGRAPRSGSGSNLGAGVPLVAGTSLLSVIKDPQTSALAQETIDLLENKVAQEWQSKTAYDIKNIKRGLFSSKIQGQLFTETPYEGEGFTTEMFQSSVKNVELKIDRGLFQESLSNRRLRTAAIATTFKIAQSAIQLAQHRSGNSFFNQQLNNYNRLGTNVVSVAGAAAFLGGPAAIFVGAGILINEGLNIGVDVLNYNYDRKLDTMMVHNMAEVSGNLSYGRRGGSR
jgi:hypothetical protein